MLNKIRTVLTYRDVTPHFENLRTRSCRESDYDIEVEELDYREI